MCSQYQWVDDKGKKVKVTASQYIEYVTGYTQKTICDETVFPTKYGKGSALEALGNRRGAFGSLKGVFGGTLM